LSSSFIAASAALASKVIPGVGEVDESTAGAPAIGTSGADVTPIGVDAGVVLISFVVGLVPRPSPSSLLTSIAVGVGVSVGVGGLDPGVIPSIDLGGVVGVVGVVGVGVSSIIVRSRL
jgi:hypothetical protein